MPATPSPPPTPPATPAPTPPPAAPPAEAKPKRPRSPAQIEVSKRNWAKARAKRSENIAKKKAEEATAKTPPAPAEPPKTEVKAVESAPTPKVKKTRWRPGPLAFGRSEEYEE